MVVCHWGIFISGGLQSLDSERRRGTLIIYSIANVLAVNYLGSVLQSAYGIWIAAWLLSARTGCSLVGPLDGPGAA